MTKLKVKDFMTPEVEFLRARETLDLASVILMLGRIRHLPVLDDDDRLVGLVTHRDLLRIIADAAHDGAIDLSSISAEEVMVDCVSTVHPTSLIESAAETMILNKYGCLPVVEDGRLVGILTESDFVWRTMKEQRGELPEKNQQRTLIETDESA